MEDEKNHRAAEGAPLALRDVPGTTLASRLIFFGGERRTLSFMGVYTGAPPLSYIIIEAGNIEHKKGKYGNDAIAWKGKKNHCYRK
mmetsp:Transcript_1523/g.3309  ORF Transcript_1523/g.3309 Transcript_1523/m.3309 type:complete len:86 (-) Transcript_1523:319-576(-)